jgi:hypothetical protein
MLPVFVLVLILTQIFALLTKDEERKKRSIKKRKKKNQRRKGGVGAHHQSGLQPLGCCSFLLHSNSTTRGQVSHPADDYTYLH